MSLRMVLAAQNDQTDATLDYLQKGVEIDSRDEFGYTALLWAARNGNTALVEKLLPYKPDLKACDNQGRTPLLWAAKENHPAIIKALLAAGADIHETSAQRHTVTHFAAVAGNLDTLAFLLEQGAPLDETDAYNDTPLTLAATSGRYVVALYLAYKGANIKTAGNGGRTAFLHLVMDREAVDKDTGKPLDRLALLQAMLDQHADPNRADNYGWTPLMRAAHDGDLTLLDFLLAHGADLACRDGQGQDAFLWAVRGGHIEAMAELLRRGMDIHTADGFGKTALMTAMRSPNLATIRFLLENGVKPILERAHVPPPTYEDAPNEGQAIKALLIQYGAMPPDPLPTAKREEATVKETLPAHPITKQSKAAPKPARNRAKKTPGKPLPAAEPQYGPILPPEREVACPCDIGFHRPVLRDHTGINFRVTACLHCGTVTVTELLVDEPQPHNVICLGNRVVLLDRVVMEWLAEWPRYAWSVRDREQNILLPAPARCPTVEKLLALEIGEWKAQADQSYLERIKDMGYPTAPPPASLPRLLKTFADVWTQLP